MDLVRILARQILASSRADCKREQFALLSTAINAYIANTLCARAMQWYIQLRKNRPGRLDDMTTTRFAEPSTDVHGQKGAHGRFPEKDVA